MCAKKTYRRGDYLRYLRDELPEKERHELERRLEADPFEKEAMEGMESMDPDSLEEDFLAMHSNLRKRLDRRRRRNWYGIAATAASILIVGSIFLNIYEIKPGEGQEKDFTEESFKDLGQPGEAEEKASAPEALEVQEDAAAEAEIVAVEARPQIKVARAEEARKEEARKEEARSEKNAKAMAPAEAPAQTREASISGVLVSSEDNEPIPGADILVKGSQSGTVTDTEGRFSLPAEDSQTTIIASYIGMETEEYPLEEDLENRLVMDPDMASLDEVVVISHGTSRKAKVNETGSVTTVELEEEIRDYEAAGPESGSKDYNKYIERNIILPESLEEGQKEVVVLRFMVDRFGNIGEIKVIRTPGPEYSAEAIRLLTEGPPWSPAIKDGVALEDRVRMRIVFKR